MDHLPIVNIMKAFITVWLVAAAACSPAKLGQTHRQGRQGGYIAPVAEQAAYGDEAAASSVVDTRVAAEPIGIRSQSFDGPNPEFRYSFETENEISQSAEGSIRTIGDADVVVMSGSYSYVGVDGETWTVDWYADETGFHPSAPHLPKPVEPLHPEIAAAVEAQLRFAAEEEAAAAASTRSQSYAAPLAGYGSASASSDDSYNAPLAGYGSY